ncbi:MAG: CPBP family intramembrane metalloprotease [Deltaproteobacteria bacterium]|nr:CPBP family intramembrane metalloprotease [Deltaproteobacteria bacterium]
MSAPAVAIPKPLQRGYWAQTRTWTYAALLALPVMVLYEAGVRLVDAATHTGIRNGADAILRSFVGLVGRGGSLVLPIAVAVVLGGLALRERAPVRRDWLGYAVLESFAYALVFGGVAGKLTALLLPRALGTGLDAMPIWAQAVLSLGAGLYEEVLFRGLVLGGLRWGLGFWLSSTKRDAAAVLLSAALFSAYHHLLGDPFHVSVFVFRLVAGVLLSLLLVLRGFGITVLTHAFYDVLFSLGLAM